VHIVEGCARAKGIVIDRVAELRPKLVQKIETEHKIELRRKNGGLGRELFDAAVRNMMSRLYSQHGLDQVQALEAAGGSDATEEGNGGRIGDGGGKKGGKRPVSLGDLMKQREAAESGKADGEEAALAQEEEEQEQKESNEAATSPVMMARDFGIDSDDEKSKRMASLREQIDTEIEAMIGT
jgi:hypothetical protein